MDGSVVFARWRQFALHQIHASLGPLESKSQMASLSVQPFLHRWLQSVPILYNGTPIPPIKIAPSHWGSGSPSNTWFPGATRVLNPNGISIGSVVLAGLTSVTDRQTDHATRSLTIDRICVRSTAIWCNNNQDDIYGSVIMARHC